MSQKTVERFIVGISRVVIKCKNQGQPAESNKDHKFSKKTSLFYFGQQSLAAGPRQPAPLHLASVGEGEEPSLRARALRGCRWRRGSSGKRGVLEDVYLSLERLDLVLGRDQLVMLVVDHCPCMRESRLKHVLGVRLGTRSPALLLDLFTQPLVLALGGSELLDERVVYARLARDLGLEEVALGADASYELAGQRHVAEQQTSETNKLKHKHKLKTQR